MTRLELDRYARHLLDLYDLSYAPSSDPNKFDMNEALFMGYERVCRELYALKVSYTRPAIPGQAVYAYSGFGNISEDDEYLSGYATAGASNMTLKTPSTALYSLVSISLKNAASSSFTSSAVTYTVYGLGMGGEYETDLIYVEPVTLGAGAHVTVTGHRYFSIAASSAPLGSSGYIKASVAQPTGGGASWQHAAGVPAAANGARVYDIARIDYGSVMLERQTEMDLESVTRSWRATPAGVPVAWIPWGDRHIRLWPPPSSAGAIFLEGYETPDPQTFASDSAEPNLHPIDHPLIAVWAAILTVVRGTADPALQTKIQPLMTMWTEGIAAGLTRIHGVGRSPLALGSGPAPAPSAVGQAAGGA